MQRRGSNVWLVAVLAIAVGFLAALLIVRSGNDKNSSATVATTSTTTTGQTTGATQPASTTSTSTTTTTPGSSPAQQAPTASGCIQLWNQANNRGDQVFLANVASTQPVRVHVGLTGDVPPKCLITVVANNGSAYVFPEAGGTTYPYAQAPGSTPASSIPPAQKITNALNMSDGTLKAR